MSVKAYTEIFHTFLSNGVAGAGLGGGSGNAATALWAANHMAGRPASNSQLLEWSADIGSDCPVFFSQGAAYCTGRQVIPNASKVKTPKRSLFKRIVSISDHAEVLQTRVKRKTSICECFGLLPAACALKVGLYRQTSTRKTR